MASRRASALAGAQPKGGAWPPCSWTMTGRGHGALVVAEPVEARDVVRARVRGERLVLRAGRHQLHDALGAGAAEHHDVQQRVGAEAVGAVHGGAGALACGKARAGMKRG